MTPYQKIKLLDKEIQHIQSQKEDVLYAKSHLERNKQNLV